eukprot:gene18591-25103_t
MRSMNAGRASVQLRRANPGSVVAPVRAIRTSRAVRVTPKAAAAQETRATVPRSEVITSDPACNVSDYIYEKMSKNLHQNVDHPLGIIKAAISNYFEQRNPGVFTVMDDLYPVVTTIANFDDVLVPADHVSRSPNDTYYVTAEKVLRCHTSAHQAETLRSGKTAFLITGDVYRRDSIDATHYPVFHQMEGVRIFTEADWKDQDPTEFCANELKASLESLAKTLFGDVECRWMDTYFPFTEPSFELEIFFKGNWLEVLGCGVMQQSILDGNTGKTGQKAWAFGLGLERLAMVLFDIPDIRLFWSDDERFLKQFKADALNAKFKSFSRFPPVYKDMA